MNIEVSIGEVLDKLSILTIKNIKLIREKKSYDIY